MKRIALTKKEFIVTKQALSAVIKAIESFLDGIDLQECNMFGIVPYCVTLCSVHNVLCGVLKKFDCAESETGDNEE